MWLSYIFRNIVMFFVVWPERSISYAARSFDNLNAGNDYMDVMPVHSIGFLNFTLFVDAPEFYATYQL